MHIYIIYIYIYIHTYIYIYIYIYVCVCVSVCMSVCVCVQPNCFYKFFLSKNIDKVFNASFFFLLPSLKIRRKSEIFHFSLVTLWISPLFLYGVTLTLYQESLIVKVTLYLL